VLKGSLERVEQKEESTPWEFGVGIAAGDLAAVDELATGALPVSDNGNVAPPSCTLVGPRDLCSSLSPNSPPCMCESSILFLSSTSYYLGVHFKRHRVSE
jgi:hypothetical protein